MIKNKVFSRVAAAFLCAVIVTGTLFTFALALVQNTFASESFFDSLKNQEFLYSASGRETVKTYTQHVCDRIELCIMPDTYSYFGERYGDIEPILVSCINEDTVRELSGEYFTGVCRALNEGRNPEQVHYPADCFIPLTDYLRPLVQKEEEELRKQQDEGDDAVKDVVPMTDEEIEESFVDLRERLAQRVDRYINSFKAVDLADGKITVMKQEYTNVFAGQRFKNLFSTSPAFPIVIVLCACAGLWMLTGKTAAKKAYNVAAILFVSVSAAAIPVMLFKAYDLPSKLLLGDSFFKIFTLSVLEGLISTAFVLTVIPMALISLALVAVIVINLVCDARAAPKAQAALSADGVPTESETESKAESEAESESDSPSESAPKDKTESETEAENNPEDGQKESE